MLVSKVPTLLQCSKRMEMRFEEPYLVMGIMSKVTGPTELTVAENPQILSCEAALVAVPSI